MSDELVEHKFKATKKTRLEISNIRGSIVINGTDDNEVCVTARKHNDSGDPEITQLDIRQDGDVVYARVVHDMPLTWPSKPCRVDFEVLAPKRSPVEVKSVSCAVDIADFTGEIRLKNVSGTVRLSKLSNALFAKSVSGPIHIDGSNIRLDVDTVSAGIHINDSNLTNVTCKTVSGFIQIQANLTQGPFDFKSVSGDSTIIVPPDNGFDVTFKALSGRFTTSLKASQLKKSGRVRLAKLNKGGELLHFKSVSGRLVIKNNETDEVIDPFNRKLSTSDRMNILDQVGRGEISVDDAIEEFQI